PPTGTSASPPTTAPTGCCADTATPPTMSPPRSISIISTPTWGSRWPATTCRFPASWVSMPTGSGCCDPSTLVLVLSFSTSTTRTTATTTTSRRPLPRSRLRCLGCTRGSTSSSPGTDTADAPPGLPAAAGLDCTGRGGDRIHLFVLQRARPVATGQEHQDVAGEQPDSAVVDDRAGGVDNAFAASGFIGSRRAMAQ